MNGDRVRRAEGAGTPRGRAIVAMVLAASAGCASEGGDLRHETGDDRTDASAQLVVEVQVHAGETGLLFTADPEPGVLARFRQVVAPSGEVVFDAEGAFATTRVRTAAHIPQPVVSFGWPQLEGDLPLKRGTWTFVLETATYSVSYADEVVTYTVDPDPEHDIAYDVLIDEDRDLEQGNLPVALVLAGEVQDDVDVADALVGAMDECSALFASVGVALDFTQQPWPDGDLAPPDSDTTGIYRQIAEATPQYAVPMVLLPHSDEFYALVGVSPILGPLVPTEWSVVAVAPRADGIGPASGAFSPEQATALGKVMAHELGHYMGLLHPVEAYGDFDTTFDGLDDTPECAGYEDCVELVGANLMFPIVCGEGCQGELSPQQGQVVQRSPGVR